MDDLHNCHALLYPGVWGFRFFIASALVWLVGWQWHELLAMVIFYALTLGVLGALGVQVQVIVKFIRGGDVVHP